MTLSKVSVVCVISMPSDCHSATSDDIVSVQRRRIGGPHDVEAEFVALGDVRAALIGTGAGSRAGQHTVHEGPAARTEQGSCRREVERVGIGDRLTEGYGCTRRQRTIDLGAVALVGTFNQASLINRILQRLAPVQLVECRAIGVRRREVECGEIEPPRRAGDN